MKEIPVWGSDMTNVSLTLNSQSMIKIRSFFLAQKTFGSFVAGVVSTIVIGKCRSINEDMIEDWCLECGENRVRFLRP